MATLVSERPIGGTKCPLSKRELEILVLLARGMVYKQIALEVGRSVSTIRTHLHNIYGKLGAHNRAQAVLIASNRGWLGAQAGMGPEALLLTRVGDILEELLAAVEVSHGKLGVTPSQRRYLMTFERYLRADSSAAATISRLKMIDQLKILGEEVGRDFSGSDHQVRSQRRPKLI